MSKFCGNCGNQSHDEAKVCGYCGYRFPQSAQPAYQQPAYQQPTYQQPVYPAQPIGGQGSINPALNKQGFPKSKIFVIIATLLQIYSTVIYFIENIVIETRYDREASSFFEYMEAEDGEFLVFLPIIVGVIALILNILTICLKKFGRAIKQIPQMIFALINFGFYTFLVFMIRDEIGYYDGFKDFLESADAKYSDGFGTMIVITVAIFALMITAAVFQSKEKKAEKAAAMRF